MAFPNTPGDGDGGPEKPVEVALNDTIDDVIIGDGYGLHDMEEILVDSRLRTLKESSDFFRAVTQQCNEIGIDVRLLVRRVRSEEGIYYQLINFLTLCIYKIDQGKGPAPFSLRDPGFNTMAQSVIDNSGLPGELLVQLLLLKEDLSRKIQGEKV